MGAHGLANGAEWHSHINSKYADWIDELTEFWVWACAVDYVAFTYQKAMIAHEGTAHSGEHDDRVLVQLQSRRYTHVN